MSRQKAVSIIILHGQHESTLILFHLFLMIIVEGKKKKKLKKFSL